MSLRKSLTNRPKCDTMSKFLTTDYSGEHNRLVGWLDYELTRAFEGAGSMAFDDNYWLDLVSPAGVRFRIFVDCGDFDYFDNVRLPNGEVLEFGDPVLQELEYHIDEDQLKHFRRLVP